MQEFLNRQAGILPGTANSVASNRIAAVRLVGR